MALGFDVGGTLGVVNPDKGFSKKVTPKIYQIQFGDGYEQRAIKGINNEINEFSVSFANRPKDEIDDIVAFFESKKGATAFNYVFSDSNAGSNEETVKVVCEKWNQTWAYDDYYNLSATFRRIYEA